MKNKVIPQLVRRSNAKVQSLSNLLDTLDVVPISLATSNSPLIFPHFKLQFNGTACDSYMIPCIEDSSYRVILESEAILEHRGENGFAVHSPDSRISICRSENSRGREYTEITLKNYAKRVPKGSGETSTFGTLPPYTFQISIPVENFEF